MHDYCCFLSAPFLATDPQQWKATHTLPIRAVEGVLFNRADLDPNPWKICWQILAKAIAYHGEGNVVFHFPVNDCNYLDDAYVYQRLCEGFQRCCDLGCRGMVVHSNQVRPIFAWGAVDISGLQRRVIDTLQTVHATTPGSKGRWIGLENMPLMDNNAVEIDPIFSFITDFTSLRQADGVGITWDICHYTNTICNLQQVRDGKQSVQWYPHLRDAQWLDFISLESHIVHWHFSAFQGIANPGLMRRCQEGVHPFLSTLGEPLYAHILEVIFRLPMQDRLITLEIQEENYQFRKNFLATAAWVETVFHHYASNLEHSASEDLHTSFPGEPS